MKTGFWHQVGSQNTWFQRKVTYMYKHKIVFKGAALIETMVQGLEKCDIAHTQLC